MQTVSHITDAVKRAAAEAGFDAAGIAAIRDFPELQVFPGWIAAGNAGEMHYLASRHESGELKRRSLQKTFPWARSVVVCAMNYNTDPPLPVSRSPLGSTANGERVTGNVSQYAWSRRDYHDVVMDSLRRVEACLHHAAGKPIQTRCYVDTGPLVERVYALYAGIGWIGKNTCIINQRLGSWLFLGVILTSIEVAPVPADEHKAVIPTERAAVSARIEGPAFEVSQPKTRKVPRETAFFPDIPAPDRCGTCTRCLDACPTNAFTAPHQLDARRCISYLTIEKRGSVPEDLRPLIGTLVFGCDICQEVCPWNRRAPVTAAPEFQPREALIQPSLEWLATISEEDFRETFRRSPIKRARRRGLRRNAVIAIGNSGDRRFLPLLHALANDPDEVVAEHARWAMRQLCGDPANG